MLQTSLLMWRPILIWTQPMNTTTAFTFDGTSVTVSDAGGDQSVDISALAYDDTQLQNDVAQNTTDIATNSSDIATSSSDIATNVTNISTNTTDITTNTGDIATNTTDIATNTGDIATNASDIATHVAADLDLDPTNEYNTALTFDGTSVTVSPMQEATSRLTSLPWLMTILNCKMM